MIDVGKTTVAETRSQPSASVASLTDKDKMPPSRYAELFAFGMGLPLAEAAVVMQGISSRYAPDRESADLVLRGATDYKVIHLDDGEGKPATPWLTSSLLNCDDDA
ncbi:hypothetical protein [Fimbriiglobus ruber]|uniref:hypothetical protein n=1 Tax=Fimbriiglobus ruber TaxID=1908690 RepID=UPI000B4AEDA0|nr:hypothetical protein [Fimbriiglobus ruber]